MFNAVILASVKDLYFFLSTIIIFKAITGVAYLPIIFPMLFKLVITLDFKNFFSFNITKNLGNTKLKLSIVFTEMFIQSYFMFLINIRTYCNNPPACFYTYIVHGKKF